MTDDEAQMPQTFTIPARSSLVSVARSTVRTILDGTPRVDDVVLITSELVTNSILWSASSEVIDIVVYADTPGSVRIEVRDDGANPHARHGDPEQHGRGLLLVSTLADKCGHDAGDGYQAWWAELSWCA